MNSARVVALAVALPVGLAAAPLGASDVPRGFSRLSGRTLETAAARQSSTRREASAEPRAAAHGTCDLPTDYDFLVLDGLDLEPRSFRGPWRFGDPAPGLAVSGPYVFWSGNGEAPIGWADFEARDFGALAMKMINPAEPLVTGDHVLWFESRSDPPPVGGRRILQRARLDGSEVTTMGEWPSGSNVAAEMVSDDTDVYFVTNPDQLSNTILKMPLAGGAAVPLYSVPDTILGLAVGETYLYWTERFQLKRMPKGGGPAEVFAEGFGQARPPLLVFGGDVLFATVDPDRILKVSAAGGPPVVLAEIPDPSLYAKTPRRLATDGTNVYWTDSESLNVVPLAGGTASTLVSGLQETAGLALGGVGVAWTERISGVVRRVPLGGGPVVTIAERLTAPGKIVALGPDSVLWAEEARLVQMSSSDELPVTVVSGVAGDLARLAADSSHLYVGDGGLRRIPVGGGPVETLGGAGPDIATDGVSIFVMGSPFAAVSKVPVTGGPSVTLYASTNRQGPLAEGGDSVFWVEEVSDHNELKAVSKTGGAATTLFSGPFGESDLVADQDFVYLSSGRRMRHDGSELVNGQCSGQLAVNATDLYCVASGAVTRVPKAGGPATLVASGLPGADVPDAIAATNDHVYFTNLTNGWVVRATPVTPQLGFISIVPPKPVAESGRSARITVQRRGVLSRAATVAYTTMDGTATAGQDYVATSGTLRFAPGAGTASIVVPILEDDRVEPSETVLVRIFDPTGCYDLDAADTAILTITDNDRAGVVQFSAPAYMVNEPGPFAVVTVVRTGGAAGDVTVRYSTSDGSAEGGVHFTPVSGLLTFAKGVLRQSFSVPILDDGVVDSNKTVNLHLSEPTGGAALGSLSGALLTIQEDNPVVQFAAAGYSARESARGIVIAVRRFGPVSGTVSVNFATSDGTARAGERYAPTSGTLTFPPGVTTQSFTVPLLNDTLQEGSQTVMLALSGASAGAFLGQLDTAVLTIGDNDVAGALAFSASTFRAAAGAATAAITVKRTGGGASGVTVDYRTADGTAREGTHYEAGSGRLTFGAGVALQTFRVPLLGLSSPSSDLTVRLELREAGGGAWLATPNEATLVLESADPKLSFSAPVYTVNEAGPRAVISVRRSGPKVGTVAVDYATADGSATGGVDYTPTSGSLTFAPNVTAQTFAIPVSSSHEIESDQTVDLSLANPTGGAALGALSTARLEIRTDDPRVQFAVAASTVAESASHATISVRRSPNGPRAVSVDFATSDGSAIAGLDYQPAAGTLAFAPGAAIRTFSVPILNDSLQDGSRTVNLDLTKPVDALLGTPSKAVLTISDNDVAGRARFLLAEGAVSERAGLAPVVVVRSGGAASGATVEYATSDGSAVADTNYISAAGTLRFEAGETSKVLFIEILDDGVAAGNKTVTLTLGSPGGGLALDKPSTAILWIVDAGPP